MNEPTMLRFIEMRFNAYRVTMRQGIESKQLTVQVMDNAFQNPGLKAQWGMSAKPAYSGARKFAPMPKQMSVATDTMQDQVRRAFTELELLPSRRKKMLSVVCAPD